MASFGESEVVFTQTAVKTKDNETGAKFMNQYQVLKVLVSGSFSTVKLWKDETKQADEENGGLVAVKILNRLQLSKVKQFKSKPGGGMRIVTALDKAYQEISIWKTLSHPNICKLIEVIDNPDLMKLYLVMDYYPGGVLMEVNHQKQTYTSPLTGSVLSPDACSKFIFDIAQALQYLQSMGVVHRDLKPDNILWDGKEKYVLSDLGNAQQLEGENVNTGMLRGSPGTYAFFAPEVCAGSEYNGYKADIWALGVTLHATLFGVPPYYAEGASQLFDLISTHEYSVPTDLQFSDQVLGSPGVCSLLMGLLRNDAADRLDIDGVIKHPFVEQHFYHAT